MPNVFISYVRDNSDIVDKLAAELRRHGVTVWLDREQIMPGMHWQDAIRKAIREGDYFIACFSAEYVARRRTYMNTEIGLAIEMLQEMPADRVWFIPVLLSECEIPDRYIGGGETLRSLQWEPLHMVWERSVHRLLVAMGVQPAVKQYASPVQTKTPPVVKVAPVPPLVGDVVTIDKPIALELIRIPASKFLMGEAKHPVDVGEFYIGKHPITNAQYAIFVGAKNHREPVHWKDGCFPGGKEDHPAVRISWDDCVAFCDWLSEATGHKFHLPTEAEWEKAARDTDGREYPWGNEPPTNELANFDRIVGDTTPVGQYPNGASPYGVVDMAGNVWEWTSSLFKGYPFDPEDGREDSRAEGERVVRGGSFGSDAGGVRCAYRVHANPSDWYATFGFRVCASSGV